MIENKIKVIEIGVKKNYYVFNWNFRIRKWENGHHISKNIIAGNFSEFMKDISTQIK